jgi:YVTN family beta-propeller protein
MASVPRLLLIAVVVGLITSCLPLTLDSVSATSSHDPNLLPKNVGGTQTATELQDGAPSYGYVWRTLDLSNGSLHPGNYVPTSCLDFSDAVVAPPLDRVFVSCTATGAIAAFNATSGVPVRTVRVGSGPSGMAFDSDHDRVYAADGQGVAVVDASNLSLIAQIAIANYPSDVTYDNSSQDLYVTDYGSGVVTVVSTRNDSILTNISLGPVTFPMGISYDWRSKDIYVAESGTNQIGMILTTNNSVASTINIGGQPYSIDCNPIGGSVYVADSAGLTVISVANQSIAKNVNLPSPPDAVHFDPGSNLIYLVTDVLVAVNATSLSIVRSIGVGSDAVSVDVDDSVGTVFVSNYVPSKVAVVNETTWTVVRYLRSDPGPYALAGGAMTGDVYITNQLNGNLLGVNAISETIQSSTSLTYGLAGVTVDGKDGHVFVAGGPSNSVFDLDPNGSLRTSILVGLSPQGIAYDGESGSILVTNQQSDTASTINASTDALIGNITLGSTSLDFPEGVVFDPANGDYYVALHGTLAGGNFGSLVAINGSTNHLSVVQQWGSPGPAALALDPSNSHLYVTDDYNDLVWAFNTSTGSLISTTPVGSAPEGISYDPVDGCLYVSNSGSNNLSVINGTTNRVVATIAVGSGPQGVLFDPFNRDIYVANYNSGTVSVIQGPATYSVTFSESGLPVGTAWGVTLRGIVNSSTGTTIGFAEPNGTYNFTVSSVGNLPWPGSGTLIVSGAGVTRSISFTSTTYSVILIESGLPGGTPWSVTLGGVRSSSAGYAIFFTEPNGSYAFNVSTVNGYNATLSTGSILVNGSFESREVAFTAIHLPLSVAMTYAYVAESNPCGEPPPRFWALLQLNATAVGGFPPYTYLWSFGDKSTGSFLQDPQHNYTTAPDIATVEVLDSQGIRANGSVNLDFAASCPAQGSTGVSDNWAIPVVALITAACAVAICVAFEVGSRRK